MCPPITHAIETPSTLRCADGRAVLCVEAGRLDQWPDALRAEIEGMDLTPFDAYRRANPMTWGHEVVGSELASQRARVRALMWLSAEAGGPVGYWYHVGCDGMIADEFIGAGPFAMWENEREEQDEPWDDSRPRSAFTAALWHIGARVPNEDECDSWIWPFRRPRIPLSALSAGPGSSAGRGQDGRDVSALTARLNRIFSAAPANEHAGPGTVPAKWIARLKRMMSRD